MNSTLNERAWKLCDALAADADELDIVVSRLDCGTRLIDCGVHAAGSVEAGRRLAEICLSGLGKVQIVPSDVVPITRHEVYVTSDEPVAACMASQYAGWEIKAEKFFAMGSGPMRAAAGREELFDDIGHRERPDAAVGVLETGKLPPASVCVDIADKCGVAPDRLTLLAARTASWAGTVQIVARSIETALHKLHVLGLDLKRVQRGSGVAPLPPVGSNDLQAIGWTNDAILYGAAATLAIRGGLGDVDDIGRKVPSCASPDYGRPFAEIFRRYNNDFYQIDPMLFSPAIVLFTEADNPEAQALAYGTQSPELLAESFKNK